MDTFELDKLCESRLADLDTKQATIFGAMFYLQDASAHVVNVNVYEALEERLDVIIEFGSPAKWLWADVRNIVGDANRANKELSESELIELIREETGRLRQSLIRKRELKSGGEEG